MSTAIELQEAGYEIYEEVKSDDLYVVKRVPKEMGTEEVTERHEEEIIEAASKVPSFYCARDKVTGRKHLFPNEGYFLKLHPMGKKK